MTPMRLNPRRSRFSIFRASPLKLLLVGLSGASLGGCFFPQVGPNPSEIEGHASEAVYEHVRLNQHVVDVLTASEPPGLAGTFQDRKPPSTIKFGIGDDVAVTIFEAAAGGLYIPAEAGIRPGNFVTLPNQQVDAAGNITVPYAGTIRAAGRTNVEVQNEIIRKIADRAIQPQVVVSLAQQRTNLVTVLGEVGGSASQSSPSALAPGATIPTGFGARIPAAWSGAGDRILDVIARAGGIRTPGFETWVTLERNRRRASVPFENLVSSPSNNIYVQPGDQIFVYRDPQRYIAFGATGTQGTYNFDNWRLTLAEAVGKAGGLLDVQADPGSVFLYRREPRKVAQALGIDLSRYPHEQAIPIIFSVSFLDPGGYFLATQVQMRNRDVIFVANAPSVQVTRFATLLGLFSGNAANASLTSFYAR